MDPRGERTAYDGAQGCSEFEEEHAWEVLQTVRRVSGSPPRRDVTCSRRIS